MTFRPPVRVTSDHSCKPVYTGLRKLKVKEASVDDFSHVHICFHGFKALMISRTRPRALSSTRSTLFSKMTTRGQQILPWKFLQRSELTISEFYVIDEQTRNCPFISFGHILFRKSVDQEKIRVGLIEEIESVHYGDHGINCRSGLQTTLIGTGK